MERERFSGFVDGTIDSHFEGGTVEDAGNFAVGTECGAIQADFQGSGIRRIANQSIANVQGETIGRPADRHTETTPVRPAVVYNQRTKSRIQKPQTGDGSTSRG